MFKKFKEKLKSWTKKVTKEAEETAELEEKPIKIKEKPEKKVKEIELPVKFEPGLQKYEPDLEALEEKEKEIEEDIKEKPCEKGFFDKIKGKIKKIKITEKEFDVYKEELELLLLENNVALEVTEKIIDELKEKIIGQEFLKKEAESEITDIFKDIIKNILIEPFDLIEKIKSKIEKQEKEPYVILFVGTNGTGKTTSIAKIAKHLQDNKLSCIMAAADTFRAASIEQLKKHGDRLKVKVISSQYGADPASVGFDAVQYAKKNFIDCVLIDTAGRMHTAKDLMREMEKISRVTKPDLKLFIGESITGNDSIEQAKSFNWAIGIDAIILTKADVDEKGGTALSVGYVTKKPILFLGTGQEYSAIKVFNKNKFIKELGL